MNFTYTKARVYERYNFASFCFREEQPSIAFHAEHPCGNNKDYFSLMVSQRPHSCIHPSLHRRLAARQSGERMAVPPPVKSLVKKSHVWNGIVPKWICTSKITLSSSVACTIKRDCLYEHHVIRKWHLR